MKHDPLFLFLRSLRSTTLHWIDRPGVNCLGRSVGVLHRAAQPAAAQRGVDAAVGTGGQTALVIRPYLDQEARTERRRRQGAQACPLQSTNSVLDQPVGVRQRRWLVLPEALLPPESLGRGQHRAHSRPLVLLPNTERIVGLTEFALHRGHSAKPIGAKPAAPVRDEGECGW